MSSRVRTVVESLLWLGASLVALALFVLLALLERLDAVAAGAGGSARPVAAPRGAGVLH